MNPKDDTTIKKFGAAVRQLRKEKGLTLLQLSQSCDVDYTTISKIERGLINTTITMVTRIAKALQVKPSVLLDSY